MTLLEEPGPAPDDRSLGGPNVPGATSPPRGTGSPARVVAIALGALVIVAALAVVAVLGFSGRVRDYPAGTPEATVQAYVRAIDSGDVAGAYAQLSSRLQAKLTTSDFADQAGGYGYSYGDDTGRVVRVDRTDVRDDRATVDLTVEMYYGGGGLTPGRSTSHPTMLLVREPSGWRLDQLYVGPDLIPEPA